MDPGYIKGYQTLHKLQFADPTFKSCTLLTQSTTLLTLNLIWKKSCVAQKRRMTVILAFSLAFIILIKYPKVSGS